MLTMSTIGCRLRDGGHHPTVTLPALGLGGHGPRLETPAGDRRREPHAGHGATRGPSGGAGVGSWLYPLVSHRWLQGVHDRVADALWPVGPGATPPGARPRTEAPVDASARAA